MLLHRDKACPAHGLPYQNIHPRHRPVLCRESPFQYNPLHPRSSCVRRIQPGIRTGAPVQDTPNNWQQYDREYDAPGSKVYPKQAQLLWQNLRLPAPHRSSRGRMSQRLHQYHYGTALFPSKPDPQGHKWPQYAYVTRSPAQHRRRSGEDPPGRRCSL